MSDPIPFSNAKTLLGQEFPYAVYDMRMEGGVCLNLEALTIVAGTIQDHGTLYLLCPQWHTLEQEMDFDSLRWNGNQAVSCPNFYAYFKQLIAEFAFEIVETVEFQTEKKRDNATQKSFSPTPEQQNILKNLPLATADIHLITAPRGRGKSTLSGKLAEQLAQSHSVLITARSHSALPNFWKSIESAQLPFLAPDKLLQLMEKKEISASQWLFVDEAASLPIPMLHRFCDYFEKVVLTTTTQNYEGTGRGFSLKFLPQLDRAYQQWQLTTPLRWGKNDPLEQFINRLLLLGENESILPPLAGEVAREASRRGLFIDFSENLTPCCPLPPASQGTSPAGGGRMISTRDQISAKICKKNRLLPPSRPSSL